MCPVFFLKQKTAYEMRISDWSSDVCSSDLCSSGMRNRSSGLRILCFASSRRLATGTSSSSSSLSITALGGDTRSPNEIADRKSVVYGKSVTVRVDHGRRRFIKNKNKIQRLINCNTQTFCRSISYTNN